MVRIEANSLGYLVYGFLLAISIFAVSIGFALWSNINFYILILDYFGFNIPFMSFNDSLSIGTAISLFVCGISSTLILHKSSSTKQ